MFTTGTGPETNTPTVGTSQTLLFGAVNSIVSVVAFTPILWNLSGPLTLFGVTLPKALFWIALAYVFLDDRRRVLDRQAVDHADLHQRTDQRGVPLRPGALARRRRGRRLLPRRADRAKDVGGQTRRESSPTTASSSDAGSPSSAGTSSVSQIIDPLPLVVQAPRLFAANITLGDVTQSSSCVPLGAELAVVLPCGLRLVRGLPRGDHASRRAGDRRTNRPGSYRTWRTQASTDGSVTLDGVEVRSPGGERLIDALDVRLTPGDALVITGPSGSGKTTLLRSLAQMWPFASGTVHFPTDGHGAMFLSQLPYVPLGDLRTVVSYPAPRQAIRRRRHSQRRWTPCRSAHLTRGSTNERLGEGAVAG